MKRRPFTALFILVTIACFVAGVYSMWRRPQGSEPAVQTPAPTTPIGEQQTSVPLDNPDQLDALILGVNQLQESHPRLAAVWFASVRPPATDIFLLGVPIDLSVQVQSSTTLQEIFAWTSEQGVDAAFIDALREVVRIEPEMTFVLDETAFAEVIDFLGGVVLEGSTLTGQQAISMLQLLSDQPSAFLSAQSELLSALGSQAPQLGSTPEITTLVNLVPQHAYSSVPVLNAAAMASPLFPIEREAIHIDLFEP